MKKPLPIGISDFQEVINGGYVYIDKSLLIEEIIQDGTLVAVIPRMRRFGKTLNLSMLRYFFEKTAEDTSYLFKNLNIWAREEYRAMQGAFPVIFITLKDVKFATWDETLDSLKKVIAEEFERHRYLLEGDILTPESKKNFLCILHRECTVPMLCRSLLLLTEWLSRYHNKKTILLIDEYDTPVHAAYVNNYYTECIIFLQNWISGGIKDNEYLARAVITGILSIAKGSIVSGGNNSTTFTVLDDQFQDKFGLVASEVQWLLKEYGLESCFPDIKAWYDGYRVGSCPGIYNPWSVLQCIKAGGTIEPYWVNTSDNALMKQLIVRGTDELKADVEELLKGNVIEKTIDEGVVFPGLENNVDAIWSLLLCSGYATLDDTPKYGIPCRIKIPNLEVQTLYTSMILDWFATSIHKQKYHFLLESLISGNIVDFSQLFQEFLMSTFSTFDITKKKPEKVYHAFVLGLLVGLQGRYEIKSNRESGLGRYDVMLIPKNLKDLGIIMEFKKIGDFETTDIETAFASVWKQIDNKRYAQELIDRGIGRILYLAFVFKGKQVEIRHKESY